MAPNAPGKTSAGPALQRGRLDQRVVVGDPELATVAPGERLSGPAQAIVAVIVGDHIVRDGVDGHGALIDRTRVVLSPR